LFDFTVTAIYSDRLCIRRACSAKLKSWVGPASFTGVSVTQSSRFSRGYRIFALP
jgi:hypothetical protein